MPELRASGSSKIVFGTLLLLTKPVSNVKIAMFNEEKSKKTK
jgi:hypothetical protein